MQLIYANRPGTPIAPVRDLDRAEIEALHRVARGESSDQAAALIRSIWQQRCWLACGCRGPATHPPLLYVYRSDSGDFTLSTMRDRPAHTARCPIGGIADSEHRRSERPGSPMPGDLLLRWFTAAKLNVVYPYAARDLLTKQYAGLREVARGLQIAPGRPLYDFSRTCADALPRLAVQLRKHYRNCDSSDPQAGDVWGVLLVVVDTVDQGCLTVGDNIVRLPMRNIEASIDAADVGGPYAMLLKYVAEPMGAVRLRRAFMQPIYSRFQLVPISAAHERRTLKTLLRLQHKLLVENDILVVVQKNLANTQAHERGIAFRLHRLGPNGRSVRDIDVVSVDARHDPKPSTNTSCPQDVVYHRVKQEAMFHELDRHFFNIALARMLDGVSTRAVRATAKAS